MQKKKETKIKDEEAVHEAAHEEKTGAEIIENKEPTEKEKLLALLQTLKDLGINSIGDLEVKISRL